MSYVARKQITASTDLSRTAVTTPADDDQLTLNLKANTHYKIDVLLNYGCFSSGINISLAWTVPTSAALRWSVNAWGVTLNQTHSTIVTTASSLDYSLTFSSFVTTDSTAGAITLKWAQGTSSVNPVTVRAGSILSAERIP